MRQYMTTACLLCWVCTAAFGQSTSHRSTNHRQVEHFDLIDQRFERLEREVSRLKRSGSRSTFSDEAAVRQREVESELRSRIEDMERELSGLKSNNESRRRTEGQTKQTRLAQQQMQARLDRLEAELTAMRKSPQRSSHQAAAIQQLLLLESQLMAIAELRETAEQLRRDVARAGELSRVSGNTYTHSHRSRTIPEDYYFVQVSRSETLGAIDARVALAEMHRVLRAVPATKEVKTLASLVAQLHNETLNCSEDFDRRQFVVLDANVYRIADQHGAQVRKLPKSSSMR